MVKRKSIPISKRSWNALNPRQKLLRERSLQVLSKSRKSSQSLSKIAKDFGISAKTVLHNTNAFKKINRKWIPKKYDKISRVMKISENGKELSVEINDSLKDLIGVTKWTIGNCYRYSAYTIIYNFMPNQNKKRLAHDTIQRYTIIKYFTKYV